MKNCHEDIFKASEKGCLECIQKYIKDLNAKTELGNTPLHWASRNGHDKCVELLLKYGATNEKNNIGDTPLHLVSRYGHDKCVELLLKYGATHEKNNKGDRPLHLASWKRHDKCVELLLKYGALQNGYNSGFNYSELLKYVKPVYVENINQYDWQTETLFYLINSKLNFNLTCSVIELLFYGILKIEI